MTEHYDAVVIGSGAGGGTLARTLAMSGKRILLLERGNFLPRELCNWQPLEVLSGGRYVSQDTWYDAAGNAFVAGGTGSADFPLANPLQATYGGPGGLTQQEYGDAFVAKMTGHSHIFPNSSGSRSIADCARSPVCFRAVRSALSVKVVLLHHALEPFAFRTANHVDIVACLKLGDA